MHSTTHLRAEKELQVIQLERQLKRAREDLLQFIKSCSHQWSAPVADFIYTPGYTIPGDPPGTMGVDRRGPIYVDSKTTPRWKRTCKICGHVEYTTSCSEKTIKEPRF